MQPEAAEGQSIRALAQRLYRSELAMSPKTFERDDLGMVTRR